MLSPYIIQNIIFWSDRGKSKLSKDVIDIEHPGGGGEKIRHLLNNLGELAKNYLEIGLYKGGSFCASIYKNNLMSATGIDIFNDDFTFGTNCKESVIANANRFKSNATEFDLIHQDCFTVDLDTVYPDIDFYYFDASHDEESQRKALTYYHPALADRFIYCVDDYAIPGVKKGTQDGIKECGFKIEYEIELITRKLGDNDSWWNGFYVALLKKQ